MLKRKIVLSSKCPEVPELYIICHGETERRTDRTYRLSKDARNASNNSWSKYQRTMHLSNSIIGMQMQMQMTIGVIKNGKDCFVPPFFKVTLPGYQSVGNFLCLAHALSVSVHNFLCLAKGMAFFLVNVPSYLIVSLSV